jgi:hypothetical protein
VDIPFQQVLKLLKASRMVELEEKGASDTSVKLPPFWSAPSLVSAKLASNSEHQNKQTILFLDVCGSSVVFCCFQAWNWHLRRPNMRRELEASRQLVSDLARFEQYLEASYPNADGGFWIVIVVGCIIAEVPFVSGACVFEVLVSI